MNPLLQTAAAGFFPLCTARLFERRRFCAVLIGLLLPLWATLASAQPSNGSIEGRVFDSHDGTALANPRVVVEGTGLEAITDETGTFRLSGVRPGQARVTVSYLGLEQTASLDLVSGGVARHEFQLRRADAGKPAADGSISRS